MVENLVKRVHWTGATVALFKASVVSSHQNISQHPVAQQYHYHCRGGPMHIDAPGNETQTSIGSSLNIQRWKRPPPTCPDNVSSHRYTNPYNLSNSIAFKRLMLSTQEESSHRTTSNSKFLIPSAASEEKIYTQRMRTNSSLLAFHVHGNKTTSIPNRVYKKMMQDIPERSCELPMPSTRA